MLYGIINVTKPKGVLKMADDLEKINNIDGFDYNTLNGIIKRFSTKGRVFANEAQFRFELGFVIQTLLGDNGKVLVEVRPFDNGGDLLFANKRDYIDLVIDYPSKGKIAIELKYKAAAKRKGNDKNPGCAFLYKNNENGDQYLFPQSAENEGSYLFLKDVARLETLLEKNTEYKKAFAIIISNSSGYWGEHKETGWKNIELKDKKTIPNKVKLSWKEGTKHSEWEGIELKNSYYCEWQDYIKKHAFPIRYMILSIPPKDNNNN